MATVLVIDDHADFLNLIGQTLRRKGLRVLAAMDGISATVHLRPPGPDLILMDYQMPAGSGVTVYERLKISSHTADIPVIFVTGQPLEELKKRVPPGPKVRLMAKPLDQDELEANLRSLLGPKYPTAPPEGGAS